MTAHQLARALLAGPDLPVVINGWEPDEWLGAIEVTAIDPTSREYVRGSSCRGPKEDDFNFPEERIDAICLNYNDDQSRL